VAKAEWPNQQWLRSVSLWRSGCDHASLQQRPRTASSSQQVVVVVREQWVASAGEAFPRSRESLPSRRRRLRIGRAAPPLAAALIGAVLFAVLSFQGHGTRSAEPLLAEFDEVAEMVGLHIDQIALQGHRFTNDTAIFAALDVERSGSILRFDSEAARRRIEALPWIEHAVIERRWPDGLDVRVTERRPFARWSDGERTALIDATGRILAYVQADAAANLPHVAGKGAPQHTQSFLFELAGHPDLARRVQASERVGDRRWRLHLANGPVIELPAEGEGAALDRVDELQRSAIFDLAPGYVIDLRLPGRIGVRGPALAAPETKTTKRPKGRRTADAPDSARRPL
jgi:cell division protein FtsQ